MGDRWERVTGCRRRDGIFDLGFGLVHYCWCCGWESPSSLAPGVGGRAPGSGGAAYEGMEGGFRDDTGLFAVPGLLGVLAPALALEAEGCASSGTAAWFEAPPKVSPSGIRCLGLAGPREEPALLFEDAFKRSSAALSRASRAWSSASWDETAFFFWSTTASRSAKLLSILKTSSKASEKERAMVDCGRPLGTHSLLSSSSDMTVRENGDVYMKKSRLSRECRFYYGDAVGQRQQQPPDEECLSNADPDSPIIKGKRASVICHVKGDVSSVPSVRLGGMQIIFDEMEMVMLRTRRKG